ncbi:hypothetical protein ADUPG1_000463, partial [Aduncisulcus paluster]
METVSAIEQLVDTIKDTKASKDFINEHFIEKKDQVSFIHAKIGTVGYIPAVIRKKQPIKCHIGDNSFVDRDPETCIDQLKLQEIELQQELSYMLKLQHHEKEMASKREKEEELKSKTDEAKVLQKPKKEAIQIGSIVTRKQKLEGEKEGKKEDIGPEKPPKRMSRFKAARLGLKKTTRLMKKYTVLSLWNNEIVQDGLLLLAPLHAQPTLDVRHDPFDVCCHLYLSTRDYYHSVHTVHWMLHGSLHEWHCRQSTSSSRHGGRIGNGKIIIAAAESARHLSHWPKSAFCFRIDHVCFLTESITIMADTPYTENSMSRKELKNAQKSVKKAKKAEDKKKVIQMNHHRGNITRILVIISLILLVAQNVFTIFGVVNMAIGFCIAVSLFLAFVILMCEFHKWPGLTMYFLFCDVRFGQAIT